MSAALSNCGSVSASGGAPVAGDADVIQNQPDGSIAVDASSCAPGDVQAFVPTMYVPAAAPTDACGAGEAGSSAAGRIYDACFGPAASAPGCATAAGAPENEACWRCIETSTAAAALGPLVTDGVADGTGAARPNVPGCVELVDPSALPCAKALQAKAECDEAACGANCPVAGGAPSPSGPLAEYNDCVALAESGGCQALAAAAAEACESVKASVVALCSPGAPGFDAGAVTARDFYFAAVPLFCEAPLVDAGSPAPDGGGAVDGAAVADASSSADAGARD